MKKHIAITGPSSMVGRHIQLQLPEFFSRYSVTLGYHFQYDFRKPEAVNDFLKGLPDETIIFHLAGYNGNIGFNKENPTDIYYNTVMMGLNLMRGIEETFLRVGRPFTLVNMLTSCAYPGDSYLDPTRFFDGKPHDSVECHGFAKRTLFEFSRQLAKKYWPLEDFNRDYTILNIVPATLYGPYDSTDPLKSKVVGSLLQKFMTAKKDGSNVTLFGTGSPQRELMYVGDFVENLLKLTSNLYRVQTSPMRVYNMGSITHYKISELAMEIASILDFPQERIVWDVSKPDGQQCKKLLMEETFSLFKQGHLRYIDNGLRSGLRYTIEFLKNNPVA